MSNRRSDEPTPDALPEPVASRLLARASELDAAREARVRVADLRAAADEAGISAHAFDAALSELREGETIAPASSPARVPRVARGWRRAAAGAALVIVGALVASRLLAPGGADAVPAVSMVDEAILLRCLAPGEAAALVRPMLQLAGNRVLASPASAPRVLTIHATREQLRQVHDRLASYEGAEGAACATRPPAR